MEKVIKAEDKRYPRVLKELKKEAPKKLYYKGDWDEATDSGIFENCLAVVGSRRMTAYGRQITKKLISQIAGCGITIVSGFMYGIDAEAHQATVNVGGRTIAIMPCGINLIHPEYQDKLYKEILENKGLIISEYEGNFWPTLWSYPRRNRIVAGLSMATLVVEAGEKSGSLITANFARKYNRKIFVVPGPLTSNVSRGICQLIKEGAEVITGAEDILDYFGIRNKSKNNEDTNKVKQPKSKIEDFIIKELQREPLEIDELARASEKSAAEIGVVLSLMQLKGEIFLEKRKYYLNN